MRLSLNEIELQQNEHWTAQGIKAHEHLLIYFTLKCLSIGTPKTIIFPFILDEKLMDFGCSNI